VSEGEFIEKGTEIKVMSVDGNRILVRELIKE
jgi:membrane-bound ClpP family serine protease